MLVPLWALALVMLLMFFCGASFRHALTKMSDGNDEGGATAFLGALLDLALAVIVLLATA